MTTINTARACVIVGVSHKTMTEYAQKGTIPIWSEPGDPYLFDLDDVLHIAGLRLDTGRYWQKTVREPGYWEGVRSTRPAPAPAPCMGIPLRDYLRNPAIHEYHGVTCIDCGGKVLDTPAYCRGVEWRCAACRRAREPRTPMPIPLPAASPGKSFVIDSVVAHLRVVGGATMNELVEVTGAGAIPLRKSMDASSRVGYDHTQKQWKLR